MTRQCGSCTKCCDGWLSAKIYDFEIGEEIGCPLRIRGGGCSVHTDPSRPHICGEFRCVWLRNEKDFLPDWMRPDISNQIVLFHRFPEYEYFEVVNAGDNLSLTMITWLVGEAKRKNINLKYKLGDEVFLIGSDLFRTVEFLKHLGINQVTAG